MDFTVAVVPVEPPELAELPEFPEPPEPPPQPDSRITVNEKPQIALLRTTLLTPFKRLNKHLKSKEIDLEPGHSYQHFRQDDFPFCEWVIISA